MSPFCVFPLMFGAACHSRLGAQANRSVFAHFLIARAHRSGKAIEVALIHLPFPVDGNQCFPKAYQTKTMGITLQFGESFSPCDIAPYALVLHGDPLRASLGGRSSASQQSLMGWKRGARREFPFSGVTKAFGGVSEGSQRCHHPWLICVMHPQDTDGRTLTCDPRSRN